MTEMIARVQEEAGSITGSRVELSNGTTTVVGRVAAESVNQFAVDWEDGQRTIEDKSNYELIIDSKTAAGKCQEPGCNNIANSFGVCDEHNARMDSDVLTRGLPKTRQPSSLPDAAVASVNPVEASENPAQPAGWAVPPVDANAYPNGELMELEMQKRDETAGWEDAQNRAPIDGENPAQPAGYAVPEASGQPIPGQGADGLMMAANVYADDITGENGLVELENQDIRMIGKVIAANDDEFLVQWQDSTRTVENKSDYNLILNDEKTANAELIVTSNEEKREFGCRKCGERFPKWDEDSLCQNCAGEPADEPKEDSSSN